MQPIKDTLRFRKERPSFFPGKKLEKLLEQSIELRESHLVEDCTHDVVPPLLFAPFQFSPLNAGKGERRTLLEDLSKSLVEKCGIDIDSVLLRKSTVLGADTLFHFKERVSRVKKNPFDLRGHRILPPRSVHVSLFPASLDFESFDHSVETSMGRNRDPLSFCPSNQVAVEMLDLRRFPVFKVLIHRRVVVAKLIGRGNRLIDDIFFEDDSLGRRHGNDFGNSLSDDV